MLMSRVNVLNLSVMDKYIREKAKSRMQRFIIYG
jgi:hypothetical protein